MGIPAILQQLNGGQLNPMLGRLQQAKQMLSMMQNTGNPQAMLNQIMQQNPQIGKLIDAAGGDPKKAFYTLCEQRGVDPDQILSALK